MRVRPSRQPRAVMGSQVRARLGNEIVVGHVIAGQTAWLATGDGALVQIDFEAKRYNARRAAPFTRERARLGSGANEYRRIVDADWPHDAGANKRRWRDRAGRIALDEPHVGLFGGGKGACLSGHEFPSTVCCVGGRPTGRCGATRVGRDADEGSALYAGRCCGAQSRVMRCDRGGGDSLLVSRSTGPHADRQIRYVTRRLARWSAGSGS